MKINFLNRRQVFELNKAALELEKANKKYVHYFNLSIKKEKELQEMLTGMAQKFVDEGLDSGNYTLGACSFSFSWHKGTIEMLEVEKLECAE